MTLMKRLSLLVLSLAFAASTLASDVEHQFQNAVAAGKVSRVVVEIPFGSFTVRNGSSERIALSGIASRDYDGQRERIWAQKVVDDTSAEIEIRGAEAIVKTKFGPNAKSWRARKFTGMDLRLELPAGLDLKFDTSAGEIDIEGDYGDIDVDLRAGEIRVKVPQSAVRELNASCRIGEVVTNLGKEIVTREGVLPGRTHFYNADGRTHVNVHTTVGEVDVILTPRQNR
jgi:hypothetical protein